MSTCEKCHDEGTHERGDVYVYCGDCVIGAIAYFRSSPWIGTLHKCKTVKEFVDQMLARGELVDNRDAKAVASVAHKSLEVA